MRYQRIRPDGTACVQAPASGGLPAAARETATVLVSLEKALLRYGVLHLLEQDMKVGRVVVCEDAVKTRELMAAEPGALLVTDPSRWQALCAMTGPSPSALRTVMITGQQHCGEGIFAEPEMVCGMLSEEADATQLQFLVDTALGCQRSSPEQEGCGRCALKKTLEPVELPLSPREVQIFHRIGEGAGPMRIAEELGLSVKTVESYRDKIKQKLNLQGREALLLASVRWRAGYYIGSATSGE